MSRISAMHMLCCMLSLCWGWSSAFAPPAASVRSSTTSIGSSNAPLLRSAASHSTQLHALDAVSSLESTVTTLSTTLDSMPAQMLLAETQAWVAPTATVLGIFLNTMSLAMLIRVVLSWYPDMKATEFPWLFVVIPTEPLLRAAKGVIPPAFGVDITPVAWLGLFTFVHEILLGQQGLLTMKIKYGI